MHEMSEGQSVYIYSEYFKSLLHRQGPDTMNHSLSDNVYTENVINNCVKNKQRELERYEEGFRCFLTTTHSIVIICPNFT